MRDAAETWTDAARNRYGRWTYDPARFAQAPVPVHHEPKFSLTARDRFFCIGSCFDRNVEEHLIYRRIDVLSKRVYSPIEEWPLRPNAFMNKYTLASMLNELRWAVEPPREFAPELFIETEGGWIDPQLSPAAHPTSFARAVERRRYLATDVFARIRYADVVVVTLGVTEAWFDHLSGLWLNCPPPPGLTRTATGRFGFASTSVTQNLDWLEQSRAAIKRLNPAAKMIVTVSPVPMAATFSGDDSATAHVRSKARLRVAADEFVERYDDVDYFPSFEMIVLAPRSLACTDDTIHVQDAAVGAVVRAFFETFIPDAPAPVSGFHEMTYLRSNPEVHAAVRRGELTSGFEHWVASGGHGA